MARCWTYFRVLAAAMVGLLAFGMVAPSAGAAVEIGLSVSATSITCGGQVTVTANVEDSGVDVPDGTLVVFSVNGIPTASTTTVSGLATVIIGTPVGLTGPMYIRASVGSLSQQIVVEVQCPVAGPPAFITLLITPTTVICGNQASVFATVRDQFGRFVANGTIVKFTTASSLGTITPAAPVIGSGGVATAVFTAFPKSSGQVQILAESGAASASAVIPIVCTTPATATQAPAPTQPPAAPAPVIRPPSTGDAGLR